MIVAALILAAALLYVDERLASYDARRSAYFAAIRRGEARPDNGRTRW
jgi:hypothetical protein